MRTSEAGSRQRGFTLLELLVVVVIIAIASAGISFVLRDSAETRLEQEASRLAALLESARAQSRLTGVPVVWRSTPDGFVFDGLPSKSIPEHWLAQHVSARADVPERGEPQGTTAALLLGPEPMIGPQAVTIGAVDSPTLQYRIFTNGFAPFSIQPIRTP